eukprot:CAMPEP_0182595066 /NCGR_PEP_ID=MMETSP1324-20130603/81509_1 /TAXON_ID=236786 /ORGANISM="Florenciella sp., Strain RCC1587" /LENGTH=59 /DNA_ID=CAMNT_0024812651 /DNA_START=111 /DNA_END=290 /DNA_ORIENTATION=-
MGPPEEGAGVPAGFTFTLEVALAVDGRGGISSPSILSSPASFHALASRILDDALVSVWG